MIVPDASSVLSAVLPDESGDLSLLERMWTEGAMAPSIWPVEVANAIQIALHRKRITQEEAFSFLGILAAFDVDLVAYDLAEMTLEVFPLAQKHRLTAYDAAYLNVARANEATLMTADRRLRAAAEAEAVALL